MGGCCLPAVTSVRYVLDICPQASPGHEVAGRVRDNGGRSRYSL